MCSSTATTVSMVCAFGAYSNRSLTPAGVYYQPTLHHPPPTPPSFLKQKWENGGEEMTKRALEKLAKAAGVQVESVKDALVAKLNSPEVKKWVCAKAKECRDGATDKEKAEATCTAVQTHKETPVQAALMSMSGPIGAQIANVIKMPGVCEALFEVSGNALKEQVAKCSKSGSVFSRWL